ncbi:MAG: TetR/AcrR family transcriptional regulator [Clostridia bacterium]|nr:TetR/AcrR family transcriptional regulator [Clostridia bacterium]
MSKKNSKNTKGKIITAAWKLFYEQGYDDTTIEEIIDESGTSKGSFYHYFEGKDALLSSLSCLFDDKYDELKQQLADDANAFDTLIFLNRELFGMIDNGVDIDLLTKLFSTQLTTKGDRHLMDNSRVYFKLLRKIVSEGQKKGELTDSMTASEIVRYYAMCERGIMYDWCLMKGGYSLKSYSETVFPMMLAKIKK